MIAVEPIATMKERPDPAPEFPRGPNCWDCRHLRITWDPRLPYGCQRMGFRSRVLPSLEVLRSDGRYCGGFEPKPPVAGKSDTPVESPTPRRQSDHFKPFIGINLIT